MGVSVCLGVCVLCVCVCVGDCVCGLCVVSVGECVDVGR